MVLILQSVHRVIHFLLQIEWWSHRPPHLRCAYWFFGQNIAEHLIFWFFLYYLDPLQQELPHKSVSEPFTNKKLLATTRDRTANWPIQLATWTPNLAKCNNFKFHGISRNFTSTSSYSHTLTEFHGISHPQFHGISRNFTSTSSYLHTLTEFHGISHLSPHCVIG